MASPFTCISKDHAPPHFHAIYGEHEATVDIRNITIHEGSLPRRAKTLVLEWATEHNEALMENWDLARAEKPRFPIPPLA